LPVNNSHGFQELLDFAKPLLRGGVTPILFSPDARSEDLTTGGRGSILAIPANSARAQSLFKFDPTIDFITAMPADHVPMRRASVGQGN